MATQSILSPLEAVPVSLIEGLANHDGIVDDICAPICIEVTPFGTRQLNPCQEMVPSVTNIFLMVNLSGLQMSPLWSKSVMPTGVTCMRYWPPVTASSTEPVPMSAVFCPRDGAWGEGVQSAHGF